MISPAEPTPVPVKVCSYEVVPSLNWVSIVTAAARGDKGGADQAREGRAAVAAELATMKSGERTVQRAKKVKDADPELFGRVTFSSANNPAINLQHLAINKSTSLGAKKSDHSGDIIGRAKTTGRVLFKQIL